MSHKIKAGLWAWLGIVVSAIFFSGLGEFLNRAGWSLFLFGCLVLVPLYIACMVLVVVKTRREIKRALIPPPPPPVDIHPGSR